MREYKYCPFCGGTPHLFSVQGIHRVDCDHCDMEGPLGSSPEDAIKRYNTRAETPIEAAAKALYRAIKTKWIKVIRAKGETFISACQIWNNFEATIRVDKEKQNEKNCKMDSCGS